MLSTLSTKTLKPELSAPLNRVILAVCLLLITYFGFEKYQQHRIEQTQTSTFILNPKVGDIYFLNSKIIQEKPALKNKYKLAKVVRVGDDGISVVYGNISYQWQHAVVNSIQYGDLRNNNYFKVIPEYIPMQKIRAMYSKEAIYLIKRPTQNKIYDSLIKA